MKSIAAIPYSFRLAFVCVSAFSFISTRPISNQEKYIEQYKDVAISEMERTGIPASIKMAQALLESQCGLSELALHANNHFGIKCKNDWTGGSYYYQDDDKNEEGEIIHSCFRLYSSALDSYKDHSDFLVNRSRYKELFSLPKTDYIAWAQGLKKCGYATDPIYSERLIKIIQKYNLDNLDQMSIQAESKDNVVKEEIVMEVRIDQPVDPIMPKHLVISTTKNIPAQFVKLTHKSKQKHKRKKRF
jgi:flagellum-specific peptidoglycan hydrolase FlgJ